MNENSPALSQLSSAALTARASALVAAERVSLVEFLRLLAELDRRGTCLELGHSSLFAYCTDELKLPNASAWRRTTSARLLTRFPAAAPLLEDGRLCLTTFVLLKDVLQPENHLELLSRAAGKTEDEVKVLVATLRPQPDVPDSIRKLPAPQFLVVEPKPPAPAARTSGPEVAPPLVQAPVAVSPPRRPVIEPISAERHVVKLTVGREFLDELEEVKSALSHSIPDGNLEAVLRYCFQKTLAAQGRRKHGAPKSAVTSGPEARPTPEPATSGPEAPPDEPALSTPSADRSRYIPAEVRRRVWTRDGGCCAYVGPNGRRCCSRHQLEFDHQPVPFALGGEATVDTLVLHCRAHNLFLARRFFGDDVMGRYCTGIASSQNPHRKDPQPPDVLLSNVLGP